MENRYIVVMGWMMSSLGLSGNDLLAYALIYGYSQDGKGMYFGSIKHTAEALNVSTRTAADILRRLEEKGVVTKVNAIVNGIQRCARCAVVPPEGKKTAPGLPPLQQDTPAPPRREPTRFKKPTVEEVREYCRQRGNTVNPERFVDFYEANGWTQGRGKPIKDWRAAVRTWETSNNHIYGQRYNKSGNKEATLAQRRAEVADEVARLDAEFRARVAGENDAGRVVQPVQSEPRGSD